MSKWKGKINFEVMPQHNGDDLITESDVITISGGLQTQIDNKDDYTSWSFAVDGVTKDAITSGDVFDIVGGDNITVTRTAEDQITISGTTAGGGTGEYTHEVNFSSNQLQLPTIFAGNRPSYGIDAPLGVLLFSNNERCYGSFKVPDDFKDGTDIILDVNYLNDSVQTGTNACGWYLDYRTYSDGDTNGAKTTTTINVSDSLPNNAAAQTFQETSITLDDADANNPFDAGNTVSFMFYRAASDTMTGDAAMMNIVFKITCEV